MTKKRNTKKEILDIAEQLILTKGYNSLSYNEISEKVGIKKASIHHHFPRKKDLGLAYVKYYYEGFVDWSEGISKKSNKEKLEALYKMYKYLSNNCRHICPIGMLTVEYPTLPTEIQEQVNKLYIYFQKWLADVLDDGISQREFINTINPKIMSKIIINALSGTLEEVRISNELDQIDRIYEEFKHILFIS